MLSVFLISGCGPVYSDNTEVSTAIVQTIGSPYISTETWDADPEVDGLEFYLSPKDRQDTLVRTDGTVNIKLYRLECIEENEYLGCVKEACTKKESDLIEAWSVPVKKDDYGIMGVQIRAEYKNYKPITQGSSIDKLSEKGCAEITLVTLDGKAFTALNDNVFMSGI